MESSSSKSKALNGLTKEEVELEDLWSELCALKNLYGLLLKTDLDEKSRVLLKKLLDGATHQTLQTQAMIVCHTPEPAFTLPSSDKNTPKLPIESDHPVEKPEHTEHNPKISNEIPHVSEKNDSKLTEKVSDNPNKLQLYRPMSTQALHNKAESVHSATSSVKLTPGKEEFKLESKPQVKTMQKPNPELKKENIHRQNSKRSTKVSSSKRLPPHQSHCDRKPSESKINISKKQNEIKPIKATSQGGSDLMAIVPAEKRGRVNKTCLLPRTSVNQTRKIGPIDRQLTTSKHVNVKERPKPRSRNGSPTISKLPSRVESARHKKVLNRENKTTSKNSEYGKEKILVSTNHSLRTPYKGKSVGYSTSSSSQSYSSTNSFSSKSDRRVMKTSLASFRSKPSPPPSLRRLPSHRKSIVPLKTSKNTKQKEKNKEGRLKRIKNKIAVIFHHHHHHHHHLHEDGQVPLNQSKEKLHRSPWTYLKNAMHRKRKDIDVSGKVVKVSTHAQGKEEHGYLHALVEGFIRHVWGMRKKKVRVGRAKGRRRLHWWQRFKRRGGVKLTGKKMPRVRLLGLGRSNSRNWKS